MSTTFPFASVRGIPIRAHVSAVVAFAALVFILASAYLPSMLPAERGPTYWSVGFISTFFLFCSTIAHELGHSLVARARGIPVTSITLVLFGGSSDIRRENEKPLDELLIAVSGPGVSLVIAALAAGARYGIPHQSQPLMLFLESVVLLNIWLGIFNLLPTLPLDGGRALRGLLWQRMGDYRRATYIASLIGRGIAAALLVVGVALFVVSLEGERSPLTSVWGYEPRLVALVAVAAAWFLNSGARSAYRQVELQGRFAGIKVADLMTPDPVTAAPWTSLDEIVAQHFLQRGERAVAVVREGDVLMGLVTFGDVRKVARSDWPSRAAGEVMTPAADLVIVLPSDPVDVAIRHMAQRHLNQLPVVTDGKLVGMIARVNVLRLLEVKETLSS
jgi:Zn-dependent protease/predicted transcriptional regulator